jgi:hypothetical protein
MIGIEAASESLEFETIISSPCNTHLLEYIDDTDIDIDKEELAELLAHYTSFTPAIKKLQEELKKSDSHKEHPNFLGSGSTCEVFAIELDERQFAVRIPTGKFTSPDIINTYITSLMRGKGIPHLEQIIAASCTEGITISELIKGKDSGKMNLREIRDITDSQIEDFIDLLILTYQKNITVDYKPSNILYDRDSGFSIVDYIVNKNNNTEEDNLEDIIKMGAQTIICFGFYTGEYKKEMNSEDYKNKLLLFKENLKVLKRYKSLLKSKIEGDTLLDSVDEINLIIKSYRKNIKNHSNSKWIKTQIELSKGTE